MSCGSKSKTRDTGEDVLQESSVSRTEGAQLLDGVKRIK